MQASLVEQPVSKPETGLSLSQPVSPWNVLKATVIKDLQITWRYRANLIGRFVELAIRLLFFLLLSNITAFTTEEVLGRAMTGRDLFIFFQGALLLFIFKGTALWTPLNAVTRDLYNGTLEFLYSNPSSRYAYYIGTVLSDVLIAQVVFLPIYLFLFFYSQAGIGNMLAVLLVCGVVFCTLVAMGVMIGLLGLLWRQVSAIAGVLEILLEMISGAYFPLAVLPLAVQYVAYLLPFTWGYDLIRYYSFDGAWKPLLPVWQEWAILVAYAVIFTIISRYLLKRVEQHSKKNGLHLI